MTSVHITKLVHPTHFRLNLEEAQVKLFSLHASCTICESTNEQLEAVRIGGEDWESFVSVVVCSDCGSVYYQNPPSQQYMTYYYDEVWNKEQETEKSIIAKNQRPRFKIADILDDIGESPSDKRILDLGCGLTGLMKGLRSRGYENVFGLEASSYRATEARRHFGDRIFHGVYENYVVKKKFDIVFSNHVIEHVHRPADAFRWIWDNLVDDGLAIIAVPNARWESTINQALFLPHLHSHTHKGICRIAQSVGFFAKFWKGRRNDEIVVVLSKCEKTLNSNCTNFYMLDDDLDVPPTAQLARLQEVWRSSVNNGAISYTYGETHTLTDAMQRSKGYARLSKVQSFVVRAGSFATQLLNWIGAIKLSRHLSFFLVRISNPGCQIIGWNYITIEVRSSKQDIPIISLDSGRAALHMK